MDLRGGNVGFLSAPNPDVEHNWFLMDSGGDAPLPVSMKNARISLKLQRWPEGRPNEECVRTLQVDALLEALRSD